MIATKTMTPISCLREGRQILGIDISDHLDGDIYPYRGKSESSVNFTEEKELDLCDYCFHFDVSVEADIVAYHEPASYYYPSESDIEIVNRYVDVSLVCVYQDDEDGFPEEVSLTDDERREIEEYLKTIIDVY